MKVVEVINSWLGFEKLAILKKNEKGYHKYKMLKYWFIRVCWQWSTSQIITFTPGTDEALPHNARDSLTDSWVHFSQGKNSCYE